MKTSEVLKQAKALIDTPEKWCQHVYAKLPSGVSTLGDDQHACQFCSLGALQRFNPQVPVRDFIPPTSVTMYLRPDSWYQAISFLRRAVRVEPGYECCDIADFNDDKPHADVMRVWDRAIALAEEEESKLCESSS